jgi:valyl-tRNA synthetase
MQEISKAYQASDWENKLYKLWEKSGYFNPDNLPDERNQTFCTIMPPPNANGRLHVGHGLDITIKDVAIRYKRMAGYKTLMLPGADHAGFETQIVYERKLEQESRTRFDMQPQELYNNIMKFTLENKHFMQDDIRRMGASCDWSREKFTLDNAIVLQVQKTFKKMFDDGLIYRGSRIVNWCSKHQTSLSEVETEFVEKKDPFYYFQYGPFVIGTARPETKFGDKYVVMHPDDARYANYTHGQKIGLEWINGPMTATVIKDEAIDMEFGTGVMTITPWHDPIDFDIAQRHKLEQEQIIDFDGTLLPIAGEFTGLSISDVRPKIIAKLQKKGLIVNTENDYAHNVKVCYKCNTNIEPQIKEQWFVKMKPLAEMAMQPVRDGRIAFIPKRFEKIFFHWMNNTIDWNISRQIVWGIPIPAKICDTCHYGLPDIEDLLHTCKHCNTPLRKDTDTFDTWFSSGQWPLLALGYPEGKDFADYYPTDIMETGADLVFKWVPRMIMFGMYLTKKEPFKKVYFHGMVNDEHNQKMSKSKGNVISPVELSTQFGTDAMRMSLIIGNGPGNNIPLSKQKVESFRNFTNKLWNIGRYVITHSETNTTHPIPVSHADHWICFQLHTIITEVTENLNHYNFSIAGEILRDFTWNKFADWYIEIHKIEKNDGILRFIFESLLKLWHPFMPFVTEALWQQTKTASDDMLMIQTWPVANFSIDMHQAKNFETLIALITSLRNLRSIYHIDLVTKLTISIQTPHQDRIISQLPIITRLAHIAEVHFINTDDAIPKQSAYALVGDTKLFAHLDGVLDSSKEKSRLEKELLESENYTTRLKEKLQNPTFIGKAPEAIVSQTRAELETAQKKIHEIKQHLAGLF